ncbi:MAG: asparagine synthase-related protein [Aigarchaeota archaeon]|nr:asparagine synthase-related protein [Candidatus Calditenuaceae archaeon]
MLRLSHRWPRSEFFIDGGRVSLSELADLRGRVRLMVHHAGFGVIDERGEGFVISLQPSKILGLTELRDSPFCSEIRLSGECVVVKSGPVGSPPLAYYRTAELIAASCPPLLLGIEGGEMRVVPPNYNMRVSFDESRVEGQVIKSFPPSPPPASVSDAANLIYEELLASVRRSVSRGCAVLFSGGLDSSVLLSLCLTLGLNPLAISAGLTGSHDLLASKRAAELLGADYLEVALSEKEIVESRNYLARNLPLRSKMDEALAVLIYVSSLRAVLDGRRQVVSGQGADELFGGYMKYLRLAKSSGVVAAVAEMKKDLSELWVAGLPRDYASAALGGALFTVPYLDERIVSNTYNLPPEFRISGGVRKVVLREVARVAGLPEELVEREKKAAQYGTGIERVLKRLVAREVRGS